MKNNRHHCIHLQRAWNKYGEDNFTHYIVEEHKSQNEIDFAEEAMINEYYYSGLIYNISKKAQGGDLVSYHPELESIKRKHSENGSLWWDSKTEEEKQEFAEKFVGERNAMYGKTHTEQARKKVSDAQKGRKRSEEQKSAVSNAQIKRYSNPEERLKVSERNRKRYENPEERIKTIEANKKRYSDPKEIEKLSISGKKRYEKDYKVYFPDSSVIYFKNLCDIIEYFKTRHSVGRWTINNLIKTGNPWNPIKKEFKHLTGLMINVSELNE